MKFFSQLHNSNDHHFMISFKICKDSCLCHQTLFPCGWSLGTRLDIGHQIQEIPVTAILKYFRGAVEIAIMCLLVCSCQCGYALTNIMYSLLLSAEDAQPVNLSVPFVSETGVVLSWQLPDIAMSEQNVIFNLNYTRRASGIIRTITVHQRQGTTQWQSVGGLDPQGVYDFSVAAIYELVNSTAATVSQQTQSELNVLGHAKSKLGNLSVLGMT